MVEILFKLPCERGPVSGAVNQFEHVTTHIPCQTGIETDLVLIPVMVIIPETGPDFYISQIVAILTENSPQIVFKVNIVHHRQKI